MFLSPVSTECATRDAGPSPEYFLIHTHLMGLIISLNDNKKTTRLPTWPIRCAHFFLRQKRCIPLPPTPRVMSALGLEIGKVRSRRATIDSHLLSKSMPPRSSPPSSPSSAVITPAFLRRQTTSPRYVVPFLTVSLVLTLPLSYIHPRRNCALSKFFRIRQFSGDRQLE